MKIIPFHPTARNPWIVATLSSVEEALAAQQQGADAIEFRSDLALKNKKDPITILKEIRGTVALPILGTIRRAKDGGAWVSDVEGKESKRLRLFQKIMPYTDAIDVEIDADIRDKVTDCAKAQGLTVIASYHNCLETENKDAIVEKIEQALALGGDMIKLAYMNRQNADLLLLFDILKKYLKKNSTPITLIGMGPIGAVTRLIFPCFGSCITYGYISGSHPGAPGQVPVEALRKYLDAITQKVRSMGKIAAKKWAETILVKSPEIGITNIVGINKSNGQS